MDAGYSLDSSSQVTWREGLSRLGLGFYTKAGDAENTSRTGERTKL